ncbi:MAG TPA: methionine adenosyltransferase [Chromatiales bacterium]|nr:methionine adenosyltransferase [Chromatiales bacterium]
MKRDFMFTSESVTEGHPDKICDQISDAIIDHYLQSDPLARVAAECAAASGVVFIATHAASTAHPDLAEIARNVIRQTGYSEGEFNARDCAVMINKSELPMHIRTEVDELQLDEDEIDLIPARNQTTLFGYACNQTSAFIPLPLWLAHRLARRLAAARLEHRLDYLLPDGTTQVGVEFRNRQPSRIHSITLTTSLQENGTELSRLKNDLMEHVIEPVFALEGLKPDEHTHVFINPEGMLMGGGPSLHAGLTGRKNAMDTYGGFARHSGSALSGKDPGRIDRVAAYAARHAAKNVVAAGLADECEVQLSYSIGQVQPVSIQIETFGTGRIDDEELARRVLECFDFRPAAIIRDFNLRHLPSRLKGGFYRKLAAYGHMGRMDIGLPWERVDKVDALK